MPVLSSGTFRLAGPSAGTFGKSGAVWSGGLSGTWLLRDDADLVAGINSAASPVVLACGRLLLSDPPSSGEYHCGFGFFPGDDNIELDGDPAIQLAGLPSGFYLTAATLKIKGGGPTPPDQVYMQQEELVGFPEQLTDFVTPPESTFKTFIYSPVPLFSNLFFAGFGVRVVFTGGDPNSFAFFYAAEISGTYDIVAWWWLLPDVTACGDRNDGQLVLSTEQPPTPTGSFGSFEKLDPNDPSAAPQPVITNIEPNHGQAGLNVVIQGSGFGQDANVQFDGIDAVDVLVFSQYQISCVVPAHALGFANVVVINPDGVTS